MIEHEFSLANPYGILLAVRDAIWYDRLSGYYDYNEACDLLEVLLVARNILTRESL